MDSFYGGIPGVPNILKSSFKSYDDMAEAFSSNDTNVYYGEFAIIDTDNKNNPENGSLFRRNYGGAEYIGNFRGTSGPISNIVIMPIGSGGLSSETILEYLKSETISLTFEDGTIVKTDDDNFSVNESSFYTNGKQYYNAIGIKQAKRCTIESTEDSDLYSYTNVKPTITIEVGHIDGKYNNYDIPITVIGFAIPVPDFRFSLSIDGNDLQFSRNSSNNTNPFFYDLSLSLSAIDLVFNYHTSEQNTRLTATHDFAGIDDEEEVGIVPRVFSDWGVYLAGADGTWSFVNNGNSGSDSYVYISKNS